MTIVSSLITDAYREANLVSISDSPTSAEQAEALRILNDIYLSAFGNEVGSELDDITIGGTNDHSYLCNPVIPPNVRLVLNLVSPMTLKLNSTPLDGQRFSIVDVAGNLATVPFTVDANGRTIELDSTETFNINNFQGQWMYFADQGDWTRITALGYTDNLPFPSEFDTYWITAMAFRLAPRNGAPIPQETVLALKKSKQELHARYNALRNLKSDLDTANWLSRTGYATDFNTGLSTRAWPFI